MIQRKPPKPKKCRVCRDPFVPARMGQKVCGPTCGLTLARADREKQAAKQALQERQKIRREIAEAKERQKKIPDLIADAQKEFNAYIRLRDDGKPCISCGAPQGATVLGGSFDAGHYRSTGAASHLRFHEDNCHAQCKRCNRRLGGNVVAYRAGLLVRIGLERLEAVENDSAVHKWTRDELIQKRKTYAQKRKDLLKMRRAA